MNLSLSSLSALLNPRTAGRVLRTVHEVVVALLLAFLPFVAVLDLPAEKVATASAVAVGLVGVVARLYNRLFPAGDPLDEDPLN